MTRTLGRQLPALRRNSLTKVTLHLVMGYKWALCQTKTNTLSKGRLAEGLASLGKTMSLVWRKVGCMGECKRRKAG